MTFEEILDQALDMLRRRGRVTYGTLKRQFALDDAYVADLKDAMLYADSHVVDDAGRGLRWTGEPFSAAQRAFEGVGRFYGEAGVLWLVRALLQHEGRVSYRTLRQVFGFDGARLADVRAELLFTRCAVDEDGEGLVWKGAGALGQYPERDCRACLPATSDSAAPTAARLEALATTNSVVISAVTAQLVQRAFVLEALGTQALKGLTAPMEVWRVVSPLETLREAITAAPEDVQPLVGRSEELGLLLRCWEQSKTGQGQVVLISGEAGIGKSALVETLRTHMRPEGLTRVALRCSPYHTNSALYPVIAHVQQALRLARDDTAEEKLTKLEQALQPLSLPLHEAVPLMATLLVEVCDWFTEGFDTADLREAKTLLDALA